MGPFRPGWQLHTYMQNRHTKTHTGSYGSHIYANESHVNNFSIKYILGFWDFDLNKKSKQFPLHWLQVWGNSFEKLKWTFTIVKESRDSMRISQVDLVMLWLSKVKWLSLSCLSRKGKRYQLLYLRQKRKTENKWPFPTVGCSAWRQLIICAMS